MNYVIVLLFLQHFHKVARKQLKIKLPKTFDWPFSLLGFNILPFLWLPLNLLTNLFVLPAIIKKNPCKPNPMSSLFSPPAKIFPSIICYDHIAFRTFGVFFFLPFFLLSTSFLFYGFIIQFQQTHCLWSKANLSWQWLEDIILHLPHKFLDELVI